jgi:chromosomal replication initiation ATPase DnaA
MTVQSLDLNNDLLTRQVLATAAALLDAAARGDRFKMRQIMRTVVAEPGTAKDISSILRETAIEFGTTMELILHGGTDRELVDARHVVCFVAKSLGHNYSYIGRQIERDHSTVMSAVRKVSKSDRLRVAAANVSARIGVEYEQAATG